MKNKTDVKLSLVIPVFNEEKNLPLLVKKFSSIAKKENVEFILVEDSGSTDNTRNELKKLAKKYTFIKPVLTSDRGYGASIYNGLRSARGEYLAWTHADLQADPEDALKALDKIKEMQNSQKVFIKGKRYGRPLSDSFFTLGMSIFETFVLGTPLYDINAQPNLFHKSFLNLMKDPPRDFSFDLYAYYLAKSNGFSIKRFPVYFGKRIHGQSAWNLGLGSKIKFIKRTIKFTFDLKRLLRK